MRKIMVIGASGYLGTAVTALASRVCPVTAAYRTALCPVHNRHTKHIFLDFGDLPSVMGAQQMIEAMDRAADRVIIASNVEYGRPDDKTLGNYHGLLGVLRREGIKTIYISTDAVFDGKKGEYAEDDIPRPITPYGKQKLIAERIISGGQNLIIRTSYLYGNNGYINDKRWSEIQGAAQAGRPLYKATNLIRNPVHVMDLAKAVLSVTEETGVLHIGGPGLSAYEFYSNLAREAGVKAGTEDIAERIIKAEVLAPQYADEIPLNTNLVSRRLPDLEIHIPGMEEKAGRIYSIMI